MTWVKIAHPRCIKPLFALAFTPHGSIWACDRCGKRWMVDRTLDPDTDKPAARWVDLAAKPAPPPLSMEPEDVGQREMAGARRWFNHHIDGVYADLGLERPTS